MQRGWGGRWVEVEGGSGGVWGGGRTDVGDAVDDGAEEFAHAVAHHFGFLGDVFDFGEDV